MKNKDEYYEELKKLKFEHDPNNYALDNLMTNLPEHIYWVDTNNIILGCNEQQLKDFGLTKLSEIIGLHVSSFQTPENAAAIIENNNCVFKTGELISSEEAFIRNGKEYFYLSKKIPIRNNHNEIIGLLGISIDITDRKKMENDLLVAKEKAEAASRAKDDFISDMEHDLRTPFNGIGGIANVLYALSEEKYPEFRELLQTMTKSCEQWEMVHQRIFDVLLVEQITQLNIEPVSISKEVRKIQDMLAATLYLKKIRCTLKPVLPELDMIETDAFKFNLILSNLMSNAINFTEQGEVTVVVSDDNNCRIIKVIDTGIGIPADKLECIFEKFTKLSRSNTHGSDFKGVGIGLYAARTYASQLGATIDVESELDKGSTFSIKLPMNKT